MEFEFSNRIKNVKASAIREILKMMNNPDIISFGGGNPASDAFPIDVIKEVSNDILNTNPQAVLQYGISEGDINLKERLLKFFSYNENIYNKYDDLLVTSGSQQIMDFMAKCLCNEGDFVICEDPSFLGALNAFRSYGVKLIGVGLEEDGMNLEELEIAMQVNPKPKFLYIIPNFQNPSGITTSLEKRKAIYQLAKKYQIVILEDNPYGALRFDQSIIPSIKSMDDEGLVVYAASLSKIIAPGMRVALMVGHHDIIAKAIISKQITDVHTNAWAQKVMADFFVSVDVEKHLLKLSTLYKSKCDLMMEEMEKEFDQAVKWIKPSGGMFIWVTLPKNVNMLEFVEKAIENNVAVVPGNAFYSDETKECNSFRMNFSSPSDENIIKGVKILGQLTKEFCKR